MATLQEAIEYARQNPKSDFARQLKTRIQNGDADTDAEKEGLDLSVYGRIKPAIEPVAPAIPMEKPLTEKVADIWNKKADEVSASARRQQMEGQNPIVTGFHAFTKGLGAVVDTGVEVAKSTPVVGDLIKGGEDLLNKGIESVVEGAIADEPEDAKVATEIAGKYKKIWDNLDPELKDTIGGVAELANWLTLGVGKKVVEKTGTKLLEEGAKAAEKIANNVPPAPPAPPAPPIAPVLAPKEPSGSAVWEQLRRMGVNVKNYAVDLKEDANMRATLKKEKGENAVRVLEETGSPEFVNLVDKTLSKEDLAVKAKMLDVAEERISGRASDRLPRQVVADEYIVPRTKVLRTRLEDLGKTIGNYGAATDKMGKILGAKRVDTTDVFNQLVKEAKRFNVRVGIRDGELVFDATPGVSGVDQARISAIKSIFDGFKPDKTGKTSNTIAQLAATRKNLSALTKRTDAAKEIVGPGGAVDNARRMIAQKIGNDYFQATKEYSDIARVLDELDPDLKVRLSDASAAEIRNIDVSNLARRLLSNNPARAKAAFKSLDEIYAKEAKRKGITVPKQDIADLVDFAGALEEGFGITPRNTFFGQTSGGVQNALQSVPPMSVGGAVNAVLNIATKPGKSDKRALEAMRAYVREAQKRFK